MGKIGALILLLLCLSARAHGGYSVAFWPAQDNPSYLTTNVIQIARALNERYQAAEETTNNWSLLDPILVDNLTNRIIAAEAVRICMTAFTNLATSFLDTSAATNGNYEGWFAADTNRFPNFPTFTNSAHLFAVALDGAPLIYERRIYTTYPRTLDQMRTALNHMVWTSKAGVYSNHVAARHFTNGFLRLYGDDADTGSTYERFTGECGDDPSLNYDLEYEPETVHYVNLDSGDAVPVYQIVTNAITTNSVTPVWTTASYNVDMFARQLSQTGWYRQDTSHPTCGTATYTWDWYEVMRSVPTASQSGNLGSGPLEYWITTSRTGQVPFASSVEMYAGWGETPSVLYTNSFDLGRNPDTYACDYSESLYTNVVTATPPTNAPNGVLPSVVHVSAWSAVATSVASDAFDGQEVLADSPLLDVYTTEASAVCNLNHPLGLGAAPTTVTDLQHNYIGSAVASTVSRTVSACVVKWDIDGGFTYLD